MHHTTTATAMQTTTRPPERLSARVIMRADRWIYRFAAHWLRWTNILFVGCFALVLLAPLFLAAHLDRIAQPIYSVFSAFCHQRPDRSFHIAGHPLACCERCAAVYASLAIGGLLFALMRPNVRRIRYVEAASLCMPLVFDGLAVGAGIYDGNAILRVITGLMFGIGVAWLMFPWLDGGFQAIRERIETLFDRLVTQGRAAPL
jgi:uncharacterized membrane protein